MDWHRIITPSCWIQINNVNWEWDKKLNELLDEDYLVGAAYFGWANIGGYRVWVGGGLYNYGEVNGLDIPSVKTRKRLRKVISDARYS